MAEMDHNKIMRAAGNMYLADMLAEAMNQLRPNSDKHCKMVARMQRELIEMRDAECALADREAAIK